MSLRTLTNQVNIKILEATETDCCTASLHLSLRNTGSLYLWEAEEDMQMYKLLTNQHLAAFAYYFHSTLTHHRFIFV